MEHLEFGGIRNVVIVSRHMLIEVIFTLHSSLCILRSVLFTLHSALCIHMASANKFTRCSFPQP